MEISAHELHRLAAEVDDMQQQEMRTLQAELEEVHFGATGRRLGQSRRAFLTKAGIGSAVITVGSTLLPVGRLMPAAWGQELDEVAVAKFGESVELAAVDIYAAAAISGKIGPDVLPVAQLFASHHQQHAGAFQAILGAAAGRTSNQKLLEEFAPKIQQAADQAALLDIAFTLEQAAAATYLFGLGTLQDPSNAAALATILPVEAQHAVVLGQTLGKDVKDCLPSFQSTDDALDPAKYQTS